MKKLIVSLAVIATTTGICQADSGYEACLKEEQALKASEKKDCSGLGYMFNPSGCFATRKKVKDKVAQCAEIARSQPAAAAAVQQPAPQNKVLPPTSALPPSPAAPPATLASPSLPAKPSAAPKKMEAATTPAPPPQTFEQLKEENARLRIENERLKKEIELLKYK